MFQMSICRGRLTLVKDWRGSVTNCPLAKKIGCSDRGGRVCTVHYCCVQGWQIPSPGGGTCLKLRRRPIVFFFFTRHTPQGPNSSSLLGVEIPVLRIILWLAPYDALTRGHPIEWIQCMYWSLPYFCLKLSSEVILLFKMWVKFTSGESEEHQDKICLRWGD